MSRTIVIGAGLSGLTRAYALSRRGEDVVLLESSDRPGGVVRTVRRDGFLLEMGPNTVRPTRELWSLVHELGLAGEALVADAKLPRFIDWGGRLHALPMGPGDLWKTKILSGSGKRRLLAEPFVARGAGGEESVRSFFTRRLGPEIAERFVEPFVSGIWAGDASRLSVASAFPSLARWEREKGSILRGAATSGKGEPKPRGPKPPRGLLSFRDGLETFARALAASLENRFLPGKPFESLARDGTWKVRAGGETFEGDRVVVATPARDAAGIVGSVAPAAAHALCAIPHPPLAVLHLSWPSHAFPRPLHGFGQLVVPQPGRRILGAVWSSSLFADRAPAGHTLLTVFIGGSRDPRAASDPDRDLVSDATRDLSAALEVRGEPRVVSVTRYTAALPQYEFGHEGRMEALAAAERDLPGLTFLGNYRGGISVGDVVKNGLAA
jgi:oxygen-dependent protoporphyrinogen oxidase